MATPATTTSPTGATRSSSAGTSSTATTTTRTATTSPSAQGSATGTAAGATCDYVAAGTASKKVDKPSTTHVVNAGSVTLSFETSQGAIRVTGDRAKAPCTLNSLQSLASQGYFNDTICHRLTTGGLFVLQCGDPTATGRGGPGYRFADELTGKETYPAGTVAMANAGPNTNGSQFFLVYADSELGPRYTVIGQMDKASLETVQKIAKSGTTTGAADGKPKTEVKITKVTTG